DANQSERRNQGGHNQANQSDGGRFAPPGGQSRLPAPENAPLAVSKVNSRLQARRRIVAHDALERRLHHRETQAPAGNGEHPREPRRIGAHGHSVRIAPSQLAAYTELSSSWESHACVNLRVSRAPTIPNTANPLLLLIFRNLSFSEHYAWTLMIRSLMYVIDRQISKKCN